MGFLGEPDETLARRHTEIALHVGLRRIRLRRRHRHKDAFKGVMDERRFFFCVGEYIRSGGAFDVAVAACLQRPM